MYFLKRNHNRGSFNHSGGCCTAMLEIGRFSASRSPDALPDPSVATLKASYTFLRHNPRPYRVAAAFRQEITVYIISTVETSAFSPELVLNYFALRNTRVNISLFSTLFSSYLLIFTDIS